MPANDFDSNNLSQLLEQLRASFMSGSFSEDDLSDPGRNPQPTVGPVPQTARGFRVRVDLTDAKPPIWRRLDLPGDLTVGGLHHVLQIAFAWTNSHLHRFRTSSDYGGPSFLSAFDVTEGDEGVTEDDVRLDQILAEAGDRLWYEYDFGDSWLHVLKVEKILDDPPTHPVCITGRLAGPPEDCGGMWGYYEMAEWVRSGYSDDLRPEIFEDAAEGKAWLPARWDPDEFDRDALNIVLGSVEFGRGSARGGSAGDGSAPGVAGEAGPAAGVPAELAALIEQEHRRGGSGLQTALAHPAARSLDEVTAEEAASATESYRILLEVIGDGTELTGAGYLKPAVVEEIARRTGIADWWIGKANREDQTAPVAILRDTAKAVGLVSVRKKRLAPTRTAKALADRPIELLDHIAGKLPLGRSRWDHDAGWTAVAVVGSSESSEQWRDRITEALFGLGWRSGHDGLGPLPVTSPTYDVLTMLAGEARSRALPHALVAAAVARAVLGAS